MSTREFLYGNRYGVACLLLIFAGAGVLVYLEDIPDVSHSHIYGILAAIIVLATLFFRVSERKAFHHRSQHFRRIADELGFQFSDEKSEGHDGALPAFATIDDRRDSIRAIRAMRGEIEGLKMTVFDFPIRGSKGREFICGPALVVLLKRSLPRFQLQPESFLTRPLMQAMEDRLEYDIDFTGTEDRERFSSQYRLFRPDKAADGLDSLESVRRLFSDQVIAYFAAQPGLTMECNGTRLLVVSESRARRSFAKAKTIPRLIRTGARIAQVLTDESHW